MATAYSPQNDPGAGIAVGAISAEEIAADISALFPPREPVKPDPTTEEWEEEFRELTHKLADTAEDRDRLRAKVIDLTNANEGMSREIAAYEDRVQRLIAQVEALENRIDAELDENVHLKAQLYDYVVACGGLLEDDTYDVQD